MSIIIHQLEDFSHMRKAGKLAAEVLDYITEFVQPGVTTDQLNNLCHEMIIANNAIPAPLGYKGYPKSICTSINNVVCHGIPGETVLKNGDIVNIDVTVILDGWYGDTSRIYWVGDMESKKLAEKSNMLKAKRLTKVTYEAMMLGIQQVRDGVNLNQVAAAIQNHVESHNYSVVRDFCGHGIGKNFHAEPSVLHYVSKYNDIILREGMFLTIEPMVNIGDYRTNLSKKDGWTATTKDGSLSAQFEHTLAVTKDGYEIFTLSPKNYTMPPYK